MTSSLSGCGGQIAPGTERDGGPLEPPIVPNIPNAVSASCSSFYDAYRAYAARCGSDSADSVYGTRENFLQSCITFGSAPGISTPGYASDLSLCSASYLALSCNADLPASRCQFLNNGRGTLSGGQPCLRGLQCASGICSGTENGTTCGTCDSALGAGQPCTEGTIGISACSTGLTCDSDSHVCQRTLTRRESESCNSTAEQCAEGLRCVWSRQTKVSTCLTPAKKGEACAYEGGSPPPCAPHFSCIDGRCADPVARGGACTASVSCSTDGTGTHCSNELLCAPKIVCNTATLRCGDEGGLGQSCKREGCSATLRCDADTRTCVLGAALGEACDATGSNAPKCQASLTCTNRRCAMLDPALCR